MKKAEPPIQKFCPYVKLTPSPSSNHPSTSFRNWPGKLKNMRQIIKRQQGISLLHVQLLSPSNNNTEKQQFLRLAIME
jgi:hypothetical protein